MTRIITKSQLKQIILEESRRTVMDNILLETKMTLRHLCEAEGVPVEQACDLQAIQKGEQQIKQAEAITKVWVKKMAGMGNDEAIHTALAALEEAFIIEQVGIPLDQWVNEEGLISEELTEALLKMEQDEDIRDHIDKNLKSLTTATGTTTGIKMEDLFGSLKWLAGTGAMTAWIASMVQFFKNSYLPDWQITNLKLYFDSSALERWKVYSPSTWRDTLPEISGGDLLFTNPATGDQITQVSDFIGGTGYFEGALYLAAASLAFMGLQKLFTGMRPLIDQIKQNPRVRKAGRQIKKGAGIVWDWIKEKAKEGAIAAAPHIKRIAEKSRVKLILWTKTGWEKLKQACGKLVTALDPQSQPNDSNNQKELKEGMSVPTLEEIRSLRMWLTFLKEHNTKHSH